MNGKPRQIPLDLPVAQVVVPDTRWAMGHVAASFWGHPARSLVMVGITGTNGKTTTASLMAAVLEVPLCIGRLRRLRATRQQARLDAAGRHQNATAPRISVPEPLNHT